MRHLWIFLHLLGFTMWLGGGLSAMTLGISLKRLAREQLAPAVRSLVAVQRSLILPGSLLTVVSGLVLTLIIYGGPGAMGTISHWVMMMQAAGLLAALIVLIVMVPNGARISRLDPVGQAAQFDALARRQGILGMISGMLGIIALIGGALSRP